MKPDSSLKQDILIISIPFLLTGLLIIFGYRLLVSQTPEGKFSIPQQPENIEILTEDITDITQPQNPTPKQIIARIQSVPHNRAQLAEAINTASNNNANTLYLTLSLDLNPDHTLTLTGKDNSSEINIQRWVKKTVNTAHQNGLHVILALTLNATQTVTDPELFGQNYAEFIVPWAKLATEFGVSFFATGFTAGHPVFADLTPNQITSLARTIHQPARQYYNGNIGLGLCCQEQVSISPIGYNFITLIPTDKHGLEVLTPQSQTLKQNFQLTHVFAYDRDNQRVRQIDLSHQQETKAKP